MMVRFTTGIIIFAILSPLIIADDPCQFKDSTKGVLDISSLSHTDGKAAFPDVVPQTGSNYKYSYNPCKPFSEGDCKNVAACQVSMDGQFTFVLGTQESIQWNPGAGPGTNPSIAYSSGSKKVQIELICFDGPTNTFEALGEDPIETYKFRLTSKCSCWNGCKGSGPSPSPPGGGGGLPAGAVFIIVIVAFPAVYLIAFAVYNYTRHQRRGVDLIAHRTFWVAVPVYAKDGVKYLFRRVRGKGGLEYQST